MTAVQGAFPPRPLRGVRARYVHQTSCPGDVAIVTVDFEPWEEGLHIESAPDATVDGGPEPGETERFHTALAEGVRAELAEQLPGVPVALALVVHHTVVHPVDSREHSFRTAGRLAVREALALLDGGTSATRGRRPAKRGRRA
ncbi:hypothetical protein ACFU7Y_21650 [Kitasatospora sp. NPDC057542]|uniref:hypothetical protein n=1 Tax=Streptomycetaceae TaxID=2062 RepID=UPI001CCE78DE|nr:hypothetical protein [Streptomyces sp. LS1784]